MRTLRRRWIAHARTVAGLILLACAVVGWCGTAAGEAPDRGDAEGTLLQAFEVRGIVVDVTPDLSDEAFARLQQATAAPSKVDAERTVSRAALARYVRRSLGVTLTDEEIAEHLRGSAISEEERAELTRVQQRIATYVAELERATKQERAAFIALHRYGDAMEALVGERPAADAVVRLRAEGVDERTRADARGEFRFVGFPAGRYELSAEAPAPGSVRGPSWGRQELVFSPGELIRLKISAYTITLRGRVTTAEGDPVAGARVVGDLVFARDVLYGPTDRDERQAEDMRRPHRKSAVTAPDGTYALVGFRPPNLETIYRFLGGGARAALGEYASQTDGLTDLFADIRVEAAGYTQGGVPRVPLVPESLVGAARRLWQLKVRATSDLTDEQKANYAFKEIGQLPAGRGTTITGIDIVLQRAPDAAAHPEGGSPSQTEEEPAPSQP